jgi:hypothetical protein
MFVMNRKFRQPSEDDMLRTRAWTLAHCAGHDWADLTEAEREHFIAEARKPQPMIMRLPPIPLKPRNRKAKAKS